MKKLHLASAALATVVEVKPLEGLGRLLRKPAEPEECLDHPIVMHVGLVHAVELEGIARFAGHALYDLAYNILKANAFVFLINSPNDSVSA